MFTSVQPAFARVFGGEATASALTINMVPNGTNGTLLGSGSPTLNANYVTLTGADYAILNTNVILNSAFTCMMAMEIPTWTGSSPNQARLFSNLGQTGLTGSIHVDWTTNLNANYGVGTTLTGNTAPTSWHLVETIVVPGTSIFIRDATTNLQVTTSESTAMATQYAGMCLGGNANADTQYTAPINVAFAAIWASALSSTDYLAAEAQIRTLLALQGITV